MIKQSIYLSYLSSLLEGDKDKCGSIVRMLLEEGTELKDIYINLFQRSMYTVGNKWVKGEISIAAEHIATHITKHFMSIALASSPKAEPVEKCILLFCVDKEFHEIGMRMVADIFDINGWKNYSLGANCPPRCILAAIKEKKPDVIGISFNFYINVARFYDIVHAIRKHYPKQNIIIGGQAAGTLHKDNPVILEGIRYLKTLDDVENYILEWK